MTKGSDTSFSTLVLSSPYTVTYNIQYDKHYYCIISLKFHMKTWNKKCSFKAECDNGIPLKGNQSNRSKYKKTLGHRQ